MSLPQIFSIQGILVDLKQGTEKDDEEMKVIQKNDTWELTTLLKGHEPIGVKWVYKVKKNAEGKIEKYKACLVAKGYKQQARIDYEEVFAPVAHMETICLVISLAT